MAENKYAPDHGEEWLREQYVEKNRSTGDIANEMGLSPEGVRGRLEGYSIDRRDATVEQLRDGEWLFTEYREEKRSVGDIADELGCSEGSVYRWLDEHEIERIGKAGYSASRPAPYFTNVHIGGYPVWTDSKTNRPFSVHRLLAISEYGVEKVKDKHIHHKNGIPWDNRPENIEPLEPEEHHSLHSQEMHERGVFDSRDADGRFLPRKEAVLNE